MFRYTCIYMCTHCFKINFRVGMINYWLKFIIK